MASAAATTSAARMRLLIPHPPFLSYIGCAAASPYSVKELYSNLPPAQHAQLSGPSGAAQLKAAGYTAAAVQEQAPPGTFSTWDLKLAGYHIAAPSSYADHAAAASGSAPSAAIGSISPRTSRFQAAALQARQLQQQQSSRQQAQAQASQHQQGAMVSHTVGGLQDVHYFRHQVVPLMQMQAERDVPPLLLGVKELGLKVKQSWA
jgi:hypothetical protein